MGLGAKVASRVVKAGAGMVEAATDRVKRASVGFRGLRLFVTDDEPISVERFLVALVGTIREDDADLRISRRDVYARARRRRRRLGVMSFGAGPLAGVATQAIVLYCEVASICDLDGAHDLGLSDREIAGQMLVLWSLAPDHETGLAMLDGTAESTLTASLASSLRDQAGRYLPAKPSTKRGAVEVLWAARGAVADARKIARSGSARGVVFSRKQTKRFIKRAEAQIAATEKVQWR